MTKLETDLNYISSLADQPAMATAELKAEFDKAGNTIKDFINNILEDEITANIAACLASAKAYTDSSVGAISLEAEGIAYDNSESGLQADNVQDAIDEIKATTDSILTTANEKIKYSDFEVTRESITLTFTPAQKKSGAITANKSGYYPLGLVGETNTQEAIDIRHASITVRAEGTATINYLFQNEDYGNNRTATIGLDILWVKIS